MAGDWIKMRCDLWTDPRVKLLQRMLSRDAASVTGALFRLWSLADTHSEDGVLMGYDGPSIDAEVGLSGFSAALSDERIAWIMIREDSAQIPRFQEHNGVSAKSRAQAVRRNQALRARRFSRDANITQSPLAARQPEKRREEKMKEKSIQDLSLKGGTGGETVLSHRTPPTKEALAEARSVTQAAMAEAKAAKAIAADAAQTELAARAAANAEEAARAREALRTQANRGAAS